MYRLRDTFDNRVFPIPILHEELLYECLSFPFRVSLVCVEPWSHLPALARYPTGGLLSVGRDLGGVFIQLLLGRIYGHVKSGEFHDTKEVDLHDNERER